MFLIFQCELNLLIYVKAQEKLESVVEFICILIAVPV